MGKRIKAKPITIKKANEFVKEFHRHHRPTTRNTGKFAVSAIDVFRTYVDSWYDGTLHTIFFTNEIRQDIKNQICSVLAGYVLDKKNPFVKKHKRVLKNLAKVVEMG